MDKDERKYTDKAFFDAVETILLRHQISVPKESMFATSTQLGHWTFTGTTELNKLRAEVNQKYIAQHGAHMDEASKSEYFLSAEEESKIHAHYEYVLHEFCSKFQPPVPRSVLGSSMQFFKRFYLHNSVMDYHPQEILYICAYLACKVEEFNVSILQFVGNLKGDREALADMILSLELLLMQQLHYHLTVHNPFRPLEGLLIDIKTRSTNVDNAELLRPGADDFIDKSLHTDAGLIFSPSQIALAAVLSSGTKCGLSLDSYVANKLLASGGKEKLMKTVEHIKRIRFLVKSHENPDRSEVRILEDKLEHCRNQDNNPFSEQYKNRMEELLDEEDDRQTRKKSKNAEDAERTDRHLLGIT